MLHEILPHQLNNQYCNKRINENDLLCIYKDGQMMLHTEQGEIEIPEFKDFFLSCPQLEKYCVYLFSIDKSSYYLVQGYDMPEIGRFRYTDVHQVRYMQPVWKVFAASLGAQLYQWYHGNRFCGCCGFTMSKDEKERALVCKSCNHVVYPVLSPSVIVAVTNGDKILLTIGKNYTQYALIAGYSEFGETLEQTVEREVMEEVGLHVKNVRYYKSQPWPFTSSLLAGYFAELEGNGEVTLQGDELAEAVWFERGKIPETGSALSLTNEMVELFRNNKRI